MFCCVRGYGGRRAWRTTVSPTCWTPFPFRPLHARLVRCWLGCVWSVYGRVVAAAVVLFVHSCVSRLMVGLFGVGSLALLRALARSDVVCVVVLLVSVLVGRARVGLRLGLCCLLGRAWCCAGAWPPYWWGLLRWCLAPSMVGRVVLVRAPCPLWGVLCWCVAPPRVGRAVLACGPSHGRRAALLRGPPLGGACCAATWPPSWWGVLCRCVAPLMVGRAVLVPVRRGGGAWCGGVWLGLLSCVPPGGRHWVRVGGACGGVLAGAMRGLFCLSGVVFAALESACSGGCGRRLGCGCGCVDRLARMGSVLVRGPPHGWACCVGACPPPWGGVLCRCVSDPRGGACCVGACPPPWWGVLCRCVPDPRGGACCVGARPPSQWGVPCRCLPAAVVVWGSGCRHLRGGLWLQLWCWLGRGCCCVGACPLPC